MIKHNGMDIVIINFKKYTHSEFERAKHALECEFYNGLMLEANFQIRRASAISGRTGDGITKALKRLGLYDQIKGIAHENNKNDFNYNTDSHESVLIG